MKLRLDTPIVFWWLDAPNLLREVARDAIADPHHEVIVSAVVAWEIAIKRGLEKLNAPADLLRAIDESGFTMLPVTFQPALVIEQLPWHHRDPFDRILIAQAITEEAMSVTRDALSHSNCFHMNDASQVGCVESSEHTLHHFVRSEDSSNGFTSDQCSHHHSA